MYKKMHLDKRQDVATNTNVDTKFSAHGAVSGITFIGNIQRQKVGKPTNFNNLWEQNNSNNFQSIV